MTCALGLMTCTCMRILTVRLAVTTTVVRKRNFLHRHEALHVVRHVLARALHQPSASKPPEEQGHAADKAPVTHAVDNKGLHAGRSLFVVLVPEADEQIAAETNALPAEEHHHEVVAQNQQQHRENEEVEIAEEAPIRGLLLHVRGGVDVDQRSDAGDDQGHQSAERIHRKRKVEVNRADAHHLPSKAVEIALLRRQPHELHKVDDSQGKSHQHGAKGNRGDTGTANVKLLLEVGLKGARLELSTPDGIDDRPNKGCKCNEVQRQCRGLDVG